MLLHCLTLVSFLLLTKNCGGDNDTFNAVVVEYSPSINPSLDPQTNILNNVRRFVDIINLANTEFSADIIVFPECALTGFFDQKLYLEIPDPADNVRPCAENTKYEPPIVQLSCAARAAATYVVVNLSEKFYNATLGRIQQFNTDVVFDLNGIIIARYRKINLYDEPDKEPPMDKALGYFDTSFGVRFGIFTCFDIIFKKPGVELAQQYNISHFIFPSAWFSEMPFLIAIQEQRYWSYTLDVVLLASGYNMPSSGSSGTGIYLGRRDPYAYSMTEATGTFLLHAKVPKIYPPTAAVKPEQTNRVLLDKHIEARNSNTLHPESTFGQIKLQRESTMDNFSTQLIRVPDDAERIASGTAITTWFDVQEVLCHNDLCCNFTVNVTMIFNKSTTSISRGDDYSQLYYRLAAFDGSRTYNHFAIGGVQTCAIIPCTNTDISSCGLRSDDSSAIPNKLSDHSQTDFVFESIYISAVFSNENSTVGPNSLLQGTGDDYGSLLLSEDFEFTESNVTQNTSVKAFRTVKPIDNLVMTSVYARLFSRDRSESNPSPNLSPKLRAFYDLVMVLGFAAFIKKATALIS